MANIFKQNSNAFSARFDSLPDLGRWLSATRRTWHIEDSHDRGRRDWDLNVGWDGAEQLAKQGWSEGAEMVQRGALEVHAPEGVKEARWGFDVAGDVPDVGRFMAGRPDNMRRRKSTHGRAPIITMAINVNVPGSVRSMQMVNYGAAMLAAIDQMESGGRRVELYAMISNAMSGGTFVALVRIKEADEPLDLAALAFGLAHPAFPRRLGFAIKERSSLKQNPGYGSVMTVEPKHMPDWPEKGLILQGVRQRPDAADTPDGALYLVANQINSAAGETLVKVASN